MKAPAAESATIGELNDSFARFPDSHTSMLPRDRSASALTTYELIPADGAENGTGYATLDGPGRT